MTELLHRDCAALKKGDAGLPTEQVEGLHLEVPDWQIVSEGGVQRLRRTFKFRNFVQALEFTNQVGQIAGMQNHHPSLLTEWGQVTVTWWTRTVQGLHLNDFIMAAKTDQLTENGPQ